MTGGRLQAGTVRGAVLVALFAVNCTDNRSGSSSAGPGGADVTSSSDGGSPAGSSTTRSSSTGVGGSTSTGSPTGGTGGTGGSAGSAGGAETGGAAGADASTGATAGMSGAAGAAGAGGNGDEGESGACGAMGISSIRALSYLPDGSAVLAALEGGVAKLVDPDEGTELLTFIGHRAPVNAVAVSADGTTVATASDDATVKVWDASDASLRQTLIAGETGVTSVAISADGSRIAAGATDGEVFLWESDNRDPLETTNVHVNVVTGISFAGNGDRLFTASGDGSVRAWSAEDLELLFTPEDDGPYLTSLAVSPDGVLVAVGDSQRRSISIWRASDGGLETRLTTEYGVGSVSFDHTGDFVYATVGTTTTWAFPLDGGTPERLSSPIGSDGIVAASPVHDELFLATSWSHRLMTGAGDALREPMQLGPFAKSVAFFPDGEALAIGGEFGFVARAVPTGEVLVAPDWGQSAGNVNGIAVSSDATMLATALQNGDVQLWDADDWELVFPALASASIRAEAVDFSADGAWLAVAGSPGMDDLYQMPSGEFITSLGYSGYNDSIKFSPDGSLVAVGNEEYDLQVRLTSDRTQVMSVTDAHGTTTDDLAFTPDNVWLASTGDRRVTLWEIGETPQRIDLIDDEEFWGRTVAISPDGLVLAAGGSDGQIHLWSLPDRAPLPPLPGHGVGVVQARYSPDGERLAVAYDDGTVWLWCGQ